MIESALRDPFPGWNQGVNTSAPLTYLSGRGYRFYPAKARTGARHHPGRSRGARDDSDSCGAARRAAQAHLPALHLGRESAADAPAGRADRAQQSPRASHGSAARWAASRRISRPSSFRRVPTTSRASTMPAVPQAGGGVRAQRARRGYPSARKSSSSGVEKFERQHRRWRASWSRSIARTSRSWFTPSTAPTFARSTRRSRPADAEHHPLRPERDRLGATTGSTCICRDCAGIFFRSSICTRAGVPVAPARHRTLVEMLDRAAERYGSRAGADRAPAVGRADVTTTYRELRDSAHRAATAARRCAGSSPAIACC